MEVNSSASTRQHTEHLVFFVNGMRKVLEKNVVDPDETLLEYLRSNLMLCGTKLACGQGGCGACTVMVSKYDRRNKKVCHYAINACLQPVVAMHGLAVTTVEGIGSTRTGLHLIQDRIAKFHGTQCGFCTPGMVMSIYAMFRNKPKGFTQKDVEKAIEGNLCRCTGYRPILEGFRTENQDFCCAAGENCCKRQPGQNSKESSRLFSKLDQCDNFVSAYDSTQEPIFPPELQMSDVFDKQSLCFQSMDTTWFRPTNLIELLNLYKQYPKAMLVAGNGTKGLNFRKKFPAIRIAISHVPELQIMEYTADGIKVGAGKTVTETIAFMDEAIQTQPEHKTKSFTGIKKLLRKLGLPQTRNMATIGGSVFVDLSNLDVNTVFAAAGCLMEFMSTDGRSSILEMNEDFFQRRMSSDLLVSSQILMNFVIPYSEVLL